MLQLSFVVAVSLAVATATTQTTSSSGASQCVSNGYHFSDDHCVFKDFSACPVDKWMNHNCTSRSELAYIKSYYGTDESDPNFAHVVKNALQLEDKPYLPNVSLKPRTGRCLAYIPRFAFDLRTQSCVWFVYGGCDGNANNFERVEECEQMGHLYVLQNGNPGTQCVLDGYSANDTGYCTFHDASRCPMDAYLKQRCASSTETTVIAGWLQVSHVGYDMLPCDEREKLIQAAISDPLKPWLTYLYQLQPEKGPCEAHIPVFYYNSKAQSCDQFVYGGCQGNANRFHSEESCLQIKHLHMLQDKQRQSQASTTPTSPVNIIDTQIKDPRDC